MWRSSNFQDLSVEVGGGGLLVEVELGIVWVEHLVVHLVLFDQHPRDVLLRVEGLGFRV